MSFKKFVSERKMMSKQEANYESLAARGAPMCKDCDMFKKANTNSAWMQLNGACTLVEGDIAPSGHCRFWEKK